MITERMNPRLTMMNWLNELRRAAGNGSNDELAAERVVQLSEPMLAMTAASEAANPDAMRALVDRDDYREVVRKYLVKNWGLNMGIRQDNGDAEKHRYATAVASAVAITLDEVWFKTGVVTDGDAKDISDRMDATGDRLFESNAEVFGRGTSTLLRESLGLPGDAYVCALIRDEDVIENALLGMRKLGVRVEPSAFAAIGRQDPEEDMAPAM